MTSIALNANKFKYSNDIYIIEFENIISKVVSCYEMMVLTGAKLKNDENSIRDELYLHYLNKNEIRKKLKLTKFYFDRETPEDHSRGRVDIRVITSKAFCDTDAYYILECKRLDSCNPKGTSGLNAEYIKNGIVRFTSETYSTYYNVNGMIGFVVQPIDINENVKAINSLFAHIAYANVIQEIMQNDLIEDFEYSYCSLHHKSNGDNFKLYHLMLDFSQCMKTD